MGKLKFPYRELNWRLKMAKLVRPIPPEHFWIPFDMWPFDYSECRFRQGLEIASFI